MDRASSWDTEHGGDDGSLAVPKAVYEGIQAEDFASSAVDALMVMVQQHGNVDMLGDTLAYLVSNKHPDWAAELCRMVMAGPGGSAQELEHKDFGTVAGAISHIISSAPPQSGIPTVRELCTFIMELKDDGNGSSYFDCTDLGQVLGHMVEEGNTVPAGQVLYDMYCDTSPQGQVYQVLVPYVLGSLVDTQRLGWALELAKQLMYADGGIDYSAVGWAMMQMVGVGRADWAAALCAGLRDQRLRWYSQYEMLGAVGSWGGPGYLQAITQRLDMQQPANGHGNHWGYQHQQQPQYGAHPQQQLASAMQRMSLGHTGGRTSGGQQPRGSNTWVRQQHQGAPQQQQQQRPQQQQRQDRRQDPSPAIPAGGANPATTAPAAPPAAGADAASAAAAGAAAAATGGAAGKVDSRPPAADVPVAPVVAARTSS